MKHLLERAALTASLLLAVGCAATQSAQTLDVAEVAAVHARAIRSFNACDREAFLSVYAERFSFTTSNTRSAYTTREALAAYLASACRQLPSPQVSVKAQTIRQLGGHALVVGQYNFHVVSQGVSRDIAQNFTAVLALESSSWRVVAHHVSLAP